MGFLFFYANVFLLLCHWRESYHVSGAPLNFDRRCWNENETRRRPKCTLTSRAVITFCTCWSITQSFAAAEYDLEYTEGEPLWTSRLNAQPTPWPRCSKQLTRLSVVNDNACPSSIFDDEPQKSGGK